MNSEAAARNSRQPRKAMQHHSNTAVYLPVIADVEIATDTEGRFNLNALHRASGNQKKNGPSYWLALDSTVELTQAIKTDPEITVSPINVIKGGANLQGTFAVEQLAVAYANWISPKFYLQVINTFLAYKKGNLQPSNNCVLPIDFTNPTQVAGILAQSLGKVQEQAEQIEADRPKVEFHDRVVITEDAISIGKAAKTLGTGRNRLLAQLRQLKWVNRYNGPYQKKIESGHLDVKLGSFNHPRHGLQQSITPLVTGKGLAALERLLQSERCEVSL